jgi:hypothetical protein
MCNVAKPNGSAGLQEDFPREPPWCIKTRSRGEPEFRVKKRCVDRHANRDSRSFSGRHLIISPHHSPIALRHLTRDRARPGAPPFPSTVLARWPRAATLIALPPTTTVRSNLTRWTQTPAAAQHLKKKNFPSPFADTAIGAYTARRGRPARKDKIAWVSGDLNNGPRHAIFPLGAVLATPKYRRAKNILPDEIGLAGRLGGGAPRYSRDGRQITRARHQGRPRQAHASRPSSSLIAGIGAWPPAVICCGTTWPFQANAHLS